MQETTSKIKNNKLQTNINNTHTRTNDQEDDIEKREEDDDVDENQLDVLDDIFPPADPWASNIWITVNRGNLYAEAMKQIMDASVDDLGLEGVNAKFLYEDGSGPGMIREFFACLAMEIFSPGNGFWEGATPAATSQRRFLEFQPSGVVNDHENDYRFHGRVYALALKMRIPLIWNPSVKCLKLMFDETAVLEHKESKKRQSETQFMKNLLSFKNGFSEVCDIRLLVAFLSPKDLQMIMKGLSGEAIDIDNWREVTSYEGFSENDMCVEWFWQFLQNANGLTRTGVLMFSTGLACLPLEGFEAIAVDDQPSFTVTKAVHLTDNSLPTAQVCFNQLLLPNYSSYQDLEKAFNVAIKYSVGFGGA